MRWSARSVVVVAALSAALLLGRRWFAEPLAAQAPGDRSAVAAPADVDLAQSRVFIFVGKTGLGHDHGVEGFLSAGTLDLSRATDAGRLEFDLASFVADTPAARAYVRLEGETDAETQQAVTDNMLGAAVLDVENYPTATFDVESVTRLESSAEDPRPRYRLEGPFTLHGVSQRIRVLAVTEERDGWLRVRGGFVIQQTDYGIKPFRKALGAVGVADELKIWGELWVVPVEGG